MCDSFAVIDLVSQAGAVQRHLRGVSPDEKLAWLAARGRLFLGATGFPQQTYWFQSIVGLYCCFWIEGDQFVFIGDNTTFTVE